MEWILRLGQIPVPNAPTRSAGAWPNEASLATTLEISGSGVCDTSAGFHKVGLIGICAARHVPISGESIYAQAISMIIDLYCCCLFVVDFNLPPLVLHI